MKKRIDISRLQDQFVKLVKQYMSRNGMTQQELADKVGMERSHINALLNGKRKLSTYYAWGFIRGGILKASDLYDGKEASKDEEDFWKTAKEAENTGTLRMIAQLREQGVDVDTLLQALLKKSE